MTFDEALIREVSILMLLLKEGKIDDTQFERLETLLQTNELARQYYVMLVNNDLFLRDSDVLSCFDVQREFNLLLKFAEYEKTAPSIEFPKEEPKRELIQKVVYPPREKRKISTPPIVFLVMNAAAILFFILFMEIAHPQEGIEVATLSDSLNAKWSDNDASMRQGTRLTASSSKLILKEGVVELTFDNLAKAVIEAPAKFQILADDRIGLTYGKVYAAVPHSAVGFSVYTPNSKVIDLGTEFGIEVTGLGDTCLNVVKGQTRLIAGEKSEMQSMDVKEETAKMVSGSTWAISNIPYDDQRFVRGFDSDYKIVWKQQPRLDLADIVRNGNGLGTGNSQVRLNYAKGFTNEQRPGYTLTLKQYQPIKDHPFIDGIFIPNGKTVVSSQGDVFEDFLITDGVYCADLMANPSPGLFRVDGKPCTIQFDGQEYSDRGKSCIVMQSSNHGITFDLDAIRDCYNLKIDRFTSRVGLAGLENKRCNANFYVLVDGQLRYSLLGYTQKGVLNDVSVKLEDTDHFLTLATSENVDQIDYMANSTLHNNWCVFTEPALVSD